VFTHVTSIIHSIEFYMIICFSSYMNMAWNCVLLLSSWVWFGMSVDSRTSPQWLGRIIVLSSFIFTRNRMHLYLIFLIAFSFQLDRARSDEVFRFFFFFHFSLSLCRLSKNTKHRQELYWQCHRMDTRSIRVLKRSRSMEQRSSDLYGSAAKHWQFVGGDTGRDCGGWKIQLQYSIDR
jgi:hypothetical protein